MEHEFRNLTTKWNVGCCVKLGLNKPTVKNMFWKNRESLNRGYIIDVIREL